MWGVPMCFSRFPQVPDSSPVTTGAGSDQRLTNRKMSGRNRLIRLAISRKRNRSTQEIGREEGEQSHLAWSVEGLHRIPVDTNVPGEVWCGRMASTNLMLN